MTAPVLIPRKIARGVLWVTVASISARVATLVSAVILARLLDPSDFGLLALGTALITISQYATQTGFESAIIQRQDKPEEFLNAAWTFELLRGLTLYAAVFAVAPLLSSIFEEPRAVAVIRAVGLTLLLQGLRNIGAVYFRKHFDFHKQFALEVGPLVLYAPLVVVLAFYLRNVWAMVWANLAASLLACVLTYAMHEYRPRLDFSLQKAASLFRFGKWVLGNSILVMARDQGTTLFVGKALGIPALGFLNRADAFATSIFQQLYDIAWKVGYPAYAHMQASSAELKAAYLKTLHLLTLIGLPMAMGVFVLSEDFVHLVLTDKWLPIVPLMELMCLQAVLYFINTPALVAFQATGNPAFVAKMSLLGVLVLAAVIWPLSSRYGVTGVVAALCISTLAPSPLIWRGSLRLVGCSFTEWLKPIGSALISTGAMATAMVLMKTYVMGEVSLPELFALIGVGGVVYPVTTLLIDRSAKQEIAAYIKATI
jgi:O-antigen/teichoic acid export membrane protein